jgi:Ca2+-binding RTX toxin-like protein
MTSRGATARRYGAGHVEVAHNDILVGESGGDRLVAGVGNDVLIGGTGNDILEGGAGEDRYVHNVGDGVDIDRGRHQ